MNKKQTRPPAAPIVFPRADPAELEKFDPSTKVCTMNCGPHAQDPRSYAERKFLCDDCLIKHEDQQMSAADGGSWKPQQIEQIDWSGHGIAAELRAENDRLRAENERLRQALGSKAPKYGPDNPPRLRKPGESIEEYRAAMGWSTETPNVEVSGLRGFLRRSARLPGWAAGRKSDRSNQKSALAGRR